MVKLSQHYFSNFMLRCSTTNFFPVTLKSVSVNPAVSRLDYFIHNCELRNYVILIDEQHVSEDVDL